MKNFLFSTLTILAFTTPVFAKNSAEITGIQTEKVLKSSSIDRINNVSVFLCNFLVEAFDRDGNRVDAYRRVNGAENEKDCNDLAEDWFNRFSENYPDFTIRLTMYP